MSNGGAAPARKGARFEAAVVADQRSLGCRAYRLRQGGGCPVDVVSFQRGTIWSRDTVDGLRVLFIQAKTDGVISAAERAALVAEAEAAGAVAVLAVPARLGVTYREVAL